MCNLLDLFLVIKIKDAGGKYFALEMPISAGLVYTEINSSV